MTKIKKHEAALIINTITGAVSLLLPDHDDNDEMTDGELFLAAMFVRANDKAFRQPLIDAFKKKLDSDEKVSDGPVIIPPTSH